MTFMATTRRPAARWSSSPPTASGPWPRTSGLRRPSPEDLDQDLVARAEIVYVEGYLWDTDAAKEAVRLAMSIAHSSDGLVALSAVRSVLCGAAPHTSSWRCCTATWTFCSATRTRLKLLFGSRDLGQCRRRPEQRRGCSPPSPAVPRAPWWSCRTARSRCRQSRSNKSSTRPAQATCTQRVSSTA